MARDHVTISMSHSPFAVASIPQIRAGFHVPDEMDPFAFDFAFLEEAFGSGVHEALRLLRQSQRLLEFFVLQEEVGNSGKAV